VVIGGVVRALPIVPVPVVLVPIVEPPLAAAPDELAVPVGYAGRPGYIG